MDQSAPPERAAILSALDRIADPKSGKGLVEAGLVKGLAIGPGRAGFMLEVARGEAALYAPVRDAAEAALAAVPGVAKAQVVLTVEAAAEPPAPGVTRVRRGARLSEDPQAAPAPSPQAERPAHVRRVVAVASGKGGVGKSTISANLAVAFAQAGLSAGLLDADVYGPSAPRMLGAEGEPAFGPEKKLIPLEAWGVKVMSIGFIVDEGAPMIWRGPMASSAVRQMMHDVAWGSAEAPLDVLVVDLPPGTGDIQLTLIQKMKIDGVVIVSTPQEIALIDARRAAAMFTKTATPILGVVENMAWFPDPATGAKIPIFGQGGAAAEAERLGVPLLAELPIDIALRVACDEGRPVAAAAPESPAARVFADLAARLAG
ncbi:MAG: P-loop NTPase [Phenylobacterium sp.]|uniref:Mrp/NBP35 family ATP-binding protein n=1 Tax=Phenylobacterium sp. TaxID=1871053 RepID=UPI003918D96A